MRNVYHPHLIKALTKVLSSEAGEEHFRKAIGRVVDDHLTGILGWLNYVEKILNTAEKGYLAVSSKDDNDYDLCQFAIEDWELQDRAIGMRYNHLIKRINPSQKIYSVTARQLVEEQIATHKDKIQEIASKAHDLSKEWRNRLSQHRYHKLIANQLEWLSKVTVDELIRNYERWEKEKL